MYRHVHGAHGILWVCFLFNRRDTVWKGVCISRMYSNESFPNFWWGVDHRPRWKTGQITWASGKPEPGPSCQGSSLQSRAITRFTPIPKSLLLGMANFW